MLLFPIGNWLEVVTDLELADAADFRPPRQPGDQLALSGEWIEFDLMGAGAVIGSPSGTAEPCVSIRQGI